MPVPPRPVERFELAHPAVPAGLDGLTVLHVSDLHVRRTMAGGGRAAMVLEALERTPADVIVLTGDLMDEPGHEAAALEVVRGMTRAWRPRFGVFGVFGNHDTPRFQRECRRELPGIRWIGGKMVNVNVDRSEPLRLMGMDWPEDPLGVVIGGKASRDQGIEASRGSNLMPRCVDASMPLLALAHHPTSLISAAAIGVPILLAGHTHAGQIRLHPRLAPHTSSDLPMHLASGVLRLQNTLCCISRGLGDGVVEGLRINCPRQMPLYTLRRGEMGGKGGDVVEHVVGW
jgi:predicted MPP superfamily phosphohydrolase